ncbi:MAG: DUF3460 family protein [Rhodoferax sp.]|nr:DUF3460 family protein [Rhodoferax sp.]
MSIFRRPDYTSEATEFLQQLKAKQPQLDAQQSEGRGLLWDKNIDRTAGEGFRAAQVAQKPYVYQTDTQ